MPPDRCLSSYFREDLFTETDIVKMIVILSFSAIALMLTANGLESDAYLFSPLLCCIPILFAVLWFPRHGLQVTALLVAGFALIHLRYVALGFTVDPIVPGLYVVAFFWFFGAMNLFSQHSHLAVSRYKNLVENAHDAKFLCDPETLRLLCASSRFAEVLGYAPHELVGIPAEKFWADGTAKTRFIQEMKKEGYIGNMEMIFLARNGDAHAVLLSCRALVPENLFECTVVDTGNLRSERDDLVQSNGRLRRLIHQSNDIFFMQDTAGRILHFSWMRAPEHNISPDDLIGLGADALLSDDLAVRHMEEVRKVVDTGETAQYNLDLEIAGDRHTFSITIAPMYRGDGGLMGIMGSARDTTEMRRQRLACKQMAWEIDQWKEFVTTMSHELRTPLQPLIGYLQMIVDDPGYYGLSEEIGKYLRTCLLCARQEQAVVERMVELSLLAMDHIELTIREVSLRRLVDSVITGGNYDREAQMSNEISEDVCIWGDPDRLYQVVESLVSNAVKYNVPPKKVRIRYTESNKNHYIMVCDNGIGISSDVIESIFRPFYIGGADKLNRKGGRIGLGLAIANRYIQLHGGEITVTSVVGEGSTFTIRIPREV